MHNRQIEKSGLVPGIISTTPREMILSALKNGINKYGIPDEVYLDKIEEIKIGK